MQQTKRQKQKELTRQRILDTAFRLYAERGFSTPTQQIAQEAGISHGAVFVHFPTAENLQLRVLEQFAQEAGGKLHALSKAGGGILKLLHMHIDILEEYEPFYTKLISEISSLPDETRNLLVVLQSKISIHFSDAVAQAGQAGAVKDIPIHMLFNTWIGLLHYYLQNSNLFAPGESVLKRCREELIGTYMTLISK